MWPSTLPAARHSPISWLLQTQRVSAEFGKDKYGEALFVPDAGKSEAEVGL